jgi:hypothetical protein
VGQRQHEHDDAAEGHMLRIARSRARHGADLVPDEAPAEAPAEAPRRGDRRGADEAPTRRPTTEELVTSLVRREKHASRARGDVRSTRRNFSRRSIATRLTRSLRVLLLRASSMPQSLRDGARR